MTGLWQWLTIAALGLTAAGVGGPVVTGMFHLVDRRARVPAPDLDPDAQATGVRAAAHTLRGGLWIGMLERVAVFATLLAGWPEGVALALAIKGLGRYPELLAGRNPGTAERFIIGTFTSVLFAAGCAGLATIVLR